MEFQVSAVGLFTNGVDQSIYPVSGLIKGFSIKYEQNSFDMAFTAITKITGFTMDLITLFSALDNRN
jgi:hypothetical protein